MNLVKLNLYGEAYYSGATYNETIFLLEDDYKALGKDFEGMEISLGELDGKHSEVDGEVDVQVITLNEQEKFKFETDNDGRDLYYELEDYSNDVDDMIKRAKSYIDTLDCLVDIKYRLKKSDATKIEKFISENVKDYIKIN